MFEDATKRFMEDGMKGRIKTLVKIAGAFCLGGAFLVQATCFPVTAAEQVTETAGESLTESPSTEDGDRHIVILATSDMHGNIWGYSYEDNKETTNDGMARLNTYIRQVREEEPTVFLVDAGDEIQGTIMTDDIYNKHPEEAHPVMAAMNAMGYDCMVPGNHEFNWGIPTMLQIMGQADFPVMAANVLDEDGNYLTGEGWVILERDGIRLAVIGVTSPNVPIWDGGKEGIDDVTFEGAADGVRRALEEIKDQADVVMVCAHMGEYAEFDEENGSDAALKILEENPKVDILQVAHMHITVDDMCGGVPVGGVRNNGREICRYDVTLDRDHHIKDCTLQIVDMEDYEPDEGLRSIPLIKEAHEKTIALIQGGTGEDGEEGGAVLGQTTDKFQPENEIRDLPEGRLQDTAVIDFINMIQLENSGADVSACALFQDTSDLPKGDINYGDIFNIYKFDNTLYRVPVTGAELKAYMEWSAECYNQWKEGDINISFDPEYPGFRYDMFAGVDYEVNLSKPKGERIENVMFHGKPLEDDQKLTLAVNNYRYSSALKAQGLVAANKEWESSCSIRDMIVDWFAAYSPVAPVTDHNWEITGVDLCKDDPRRAELIGYINEGLLEVPYAQSYNLEDYDALVAQAKEAAETVTEAATE